MYDKIENESLEEELVDDIIDCMNMDTILCIGTKNYPSAYAINKGINAIKKETGKQEIPLVFIKEEDVKRFISEYDKNVSFFENKIYGNTLVVSNEKFIKHWFDPYTMVFKLLIKDPRMAAHFLYPFTYHKFKNIVKLSDCYDLTELEQNDFTNFILRRFTSEYITPDDIISRNEDPEYALLMKSVIHKSL